MKTVFITGTNRGFGLELSKVFLEKGWKVLGTTRDTSSHPIEQENFHPIELDVADEESINGLAEKVGDQSIDVLINNAGVIDHELAGGSPDLSQVRFLRSTPLDKDL